MNLQLNKNIFLLSLIIILAIGFTGVSFFLNNTISYNNKCSSAIFIRDYKVNLSAKLNVYLHLQDNNTGYLDITGVINQEKLRFTIARGWHFDYFATDGTTLYLKNITTDKRNPDTTPDGIVNDHIFSTTIDNKRYVKISLLKNSLVIGSLHSPIFTCVIHEN